MSTLKKDNLFGTSEEINTKWQKLLTYYNLPTPKSSDEIEKDWKDMLRNYDLQNISHEEIEEKWNKMVKSQNKKSIQVG